MIYSIIDDTPVPDASLVNLEEYDKIQGHGYRIIRGVYSNGYWESALLTKNSTSDSGTQYGPLLLVSSVGVNQNNVDHHHITHLDANFDAYKTAVGVEEFWISPVDDRASLMATRFPLWVRTGDTPISGEPLFIRSE